MHRNKELYTYLLNKAKLLTDQWYESLDKTDSSGVYASQDPRVIETLKQQNYEFHLHFCEVFIKEKSEFEKDFETWIVGVAKDEQHLSTPLHHIIKEFFSVQNQYLSFVRDFVEQEKGVSKEKENLWIQIIVKTFGDVVTWFTEEYYKHSQRKLKAQQEMITELSSPVISLTDEIGLLPIVGDIDTVRARVILEKTLQQCAQKAIDQLFIDLSGVVIIDTMVANEIYQLISALDLIGVKTTLSGIRPEIAQTAIQLGLSFDRITIKSSLKEAIRTAKVY